MIRLFVALGLPTATAEILTRVQDGVPGARWSEPSHMHLTLRFVGEVTERLADEVDFELSRIGGAPLEVTLAGVGAFEAQGVTRAIWAGVEASEALRRLQRRCERAVRCAGVAPDTRPWRAHVTLAYVSGAEPARVGAWLQHNNLLRLAPFTVAGFGLYSSWLSKAGSSYRLERTYPLREPRRDP
jgi:2'-5' RNA ligase